MHRIHPCCTTRTLVALGRACLEQQRMAQRQLNDRWGWGHSDVYRAIKRMHQYFVRSHRLAHVKGLRHVSRKFLDGKLSGLTGEDIREYERIIEGRCTVPQHRELRDWTVMHYQSATSSEPWRLTIHSIVTLLFSANRQTICTVFGNSTHRLAFYCLHDGRYHLPTNILCPTMDITAAHDPPISRFFSWGYYCRISGCQDTFEERHQRCAWNP